MVLAVLMSVTHSGAQAPGDVCIRLVDVLTGDAVRDMPVWISDASAECFLAAQTYSSRTGQDGIAVFDGVPDGAWYVTIPGTKEAWSVCRKPQIAATPDNREIVHDIRAVADGTIRIRAQYEGTGEPAAIRHVLCEPRAGKPDVPWVGRHARAGPSADGRLRLDVNPGRYRVIVTPCYERPRSAIVNVEPSETTELVVNVDPHSSCPRAIGRVRNWRLKPFEGAAVYLRKATRHGVSNPAFALFFGPGRERPEVCAVTTEGGFYEMQNIGHYQGVQRLRDAEGPFGLAAIAEGYAVDWVDLPEPATGDPPRVVDFVLQRAADVSVDITSRATGERVEGRDWVIDIYWPGRSRGEGPLRWRLEPNEDGEIHLEGAPPGDVRWGLLRATGWVTTDRVEGWEHVAEGALTFPRRDPVTIRARVNLP